MKLTLQKPDTFGAIASMLCLIHCVATPFLVLAYSCPSEICETSIAWWKNLDYFFLIISFIAVDRSVKNTAKKIMKPALWISWSILFLLIINEKLEGFPLPETLTYISALSLAALHMYNLKFCQCKTEICCTKNG